MRIDVFCDIVDNYGDAGVCWRLARRLAQTSFIPLSHSKVDSNHDSSGNLIADSIRLFCDDTNLLSQLAGGDAIATGKELGIEILSWGASTQATLVAPPDVVIETFGCTLPEKYLASLSKKPSCIVLNLEYLSAEDWIDSHHGLPSPNGYLKKYFFFPGFSKNSGTLLRGTLPNEVRQLPTALAQAWHQLRPEALKICLFCYNTPEMRSFISSLADTNEAIDVLTCYGQASELVSTLKPTMSHLRNIQFIQTPFVSQDDFDWLLAQCDLNIVRGEDSFVRAQWAEKPFIWHIYPQDDGAHHLKLEAFLKKYLADALPPTTELITQAMHLENPSKWLKMLPEMQKHAIQWRKELDTLTFDGDLAIQIRKFLNKI